uniref:EF-hand domain-containing protein n=1 Tax=Arcella intermedia TaxID=1963864 RepID=A0A6B2L6T2_9EUKA
MSSHTKFGKEEIRKLRVFFEKTATKNTLSTVEFKTLLLSLGIFPGLSDAAAESLFKVVDADGSGTIEFRELVLALSLLTRGTTEEKLGYMFDAFDKDKSGELDTNEIHLITEQMKTVAEFLQRDPKKIEPFIENILKKADVDGNGTITKDEWISVGSRTPSVLQLLSGDDGNVSLNFSNPPKQVNHTPPKPKNSAGVCKALEGRTNFGKKELEALYKTFKRSDVNHSGDLDFEEFRSCIREVKVFPGIHDQLLEQFFKALDHDGSGTIDFSELAAALSIMSKGSGEEKLGFLFDTVDTDKNGFLEKAEIAVLLKQMKVVSEVLGRDPKKMEPFIENLVKKLEGGHGGVLRDDWIRVGCSTPSILSLLAGSDWV